MITCPLYCTNDFSECYNTFHNSTKDGEETGNSFIYKPGTSPKQIITTPEKNNTVAADSTLYADCTVSQELWLGNITIHNNGLTNVYEHTYVFIIILKPFTGRSMLVTTLSHDNLYTSALGIHVMTQIHSAKLTENVLFIGARNAVPIAPSPKILSQWEGWVETHAAWPLKLFIPTANSLASNKNGW